MTVYIYLANNNLVDEIMPIFFIVDSLLCNDSEISSYTKPLLSNGSAKTAVAR
jgi:hypothetical protein